MPKSKKPAPKGGKKAAAPKKVAKKFVAKKLAKTSPVTENPIFKGAQLDPAFVERALHPTVEEQWPQYQIVVPPKPSIWRRFRSAITGLFVSKKYAEANPDTTVRERVD